MRSVAFDHSSLGWEECPCDWCGDCESESIFDGPDRLEGLPGTFRVVRCKNCGIYRQNPRLKWSSLQNYYKDDYIAYDYTRAADLNRWNRWVKNYGNVKRRKFIERFVPGGHLLEVGCGTGAFLKVMQNSGRWEVVGIEPSTEASDFAREYTQALILNQRLSEAVLEPESFDAAVLWNVIEHLEQPVTDLKYLSTLLKKDGWLFFSVPNLNSLDARLFGHTWAGWDLPRHLYVIPLKTYDQILESIGFKTIEIRCLSTSYASFGHSLSFWSQTWEARYPQLSRWLHRIYYSWVNRILLLAPLAIQDRLNLSSIITICAQKSD